MAGSAASQVGIVISAQDQASKTIADLQKRLKTLEGQVGQTGKRLDNAAKSTNGLRALGAGMRDLSRESLSAFQNLGRVVTPLGILTGAASVAGLYRITEQWAQLGSRLGFSAQRAGTTANQLSALQGAARMAGSSAESLTSGLTALSDNLTNAAAGRAPEATMAFNYLGISVRDASGHLRTATDVLPELADKIAAIKNPTIQAQVATMALGGSAEDLLPFLREGSAGIKEYTDKAREYGAINDRAARASNELRKKQVELSLATEGLRNSIAEKLEPILGPMLLKMAKWVEANRDVMAQDVAHWVGEAIPRIEAFAKGADHVATALGGWERVILSIMGIKLLGWALNSVKALWPLIQILRLIPGSGITAPLLAAAGLGFLAADSAGKQQASIESAGLKPSTAPGMMAEDGTPTAYTDGAGHLYTKEEALRIANNQPFPGEGGMEALGVPPAKATESQPTTKPLGERIRGFLQNHLGGNHNGARPDVSDASTNPTKIGFLNTLAAPESHGDYKIRNGGGHFSDFSQFPAGIGPRGTSTASGKYQFTRGTWADVSRQAGLTDFGPGSQDKGAWHLAATAYQRTQGRDLEADLREGGHEAQITAALRKIWPSLPGGSQQGESMGQFKSLLARNLGTPAQVAGGTGTSGGHQETTVRGSAEVRIKLEGAPKGTRTAASTTGDLFSGAPRIEHAMPMGVG